MPVSARCPADAPGCWRFPSGKECDEPVAALGTRSNAS
jgi:hypothetical protein